jgi:hypothetical protein
LPLAAFGCSAVKRMPASQAIGPRDKKGSRNLCAFFLLHYLCLYLFA